MRSDEMDTALVGALKERMERETGLFEELGRRMEALREASQARDWARGIAITQGIEAVARGIEEVDEARGQAFEGLRAALDLPAETAFSAVIPSLPEPARADLEDGWRRLRTSVVRLKTASATLRYSTEALSDTLARMLNDLFPHRRGKIYSRRGTANTVDGATLIDQKR